jgi:LacI family transcriptional regulator
MQNWMKLKANKITIKDVALAAGVSKQTVSRVINNRPDVASATRQRVKQVIEHLNYQPSALARSLAQLRSYTLGVAISGIKYTGPSHTFNGIIETIEELNYTLIVKAFSDFKPNQIGNILNSLLSRKVDGIIWAVPDYANNRDWIADWLTDLPVPIVFTDMSETPGVSSVFINGYAGGQLAMRHLVERGYREIGHISGPMDWWDARERMRAWRDVLTEAGMSVNECQSVEGDWSLESGKTAILKLLKQYQEMEAVFVANDQMVIGVLQALCAAGIRVPDDLALVGYDDIPETAYLCPAVTTVRQDFHLYGASAVNLLVKQIDGIHMGRTEIEPEIVELHPDLIVRDSTPPKVSRR